MNEWMISGLGMKLSQHISFSLILLIGVFRSVIITHWDKCHGTLLINLMISRAANLWKLNSVWNSHESNFTRNSPELTPHHVFRDYTFYISTTSPGGQWINSSLSGARWNVTSCMHVLSCIETTRLSRTGPWFNRKMSSYQYRKLVAERR